jgi:hypothetical protein
MTATKPVRTRPSTASAPAPLAGTVPPAEVDEGAPVLERVVEDPAVSVMLECVVVAVSVSVAVSVAEGKSVSVSVSIAEGKRSEVSNRREVPEAEVEEAVPVRVAEPEAVAEPTREEVEGVPTSLICVSRTSRQHPARTHPSRGGRDIRNRS